MGNKFMSKIVMAKGTLILVILVASIVSGAVSAGVSMMVVDSRSLQGKTGATGLQGPRGETGATGPAGATGATGSAGPTGATGTVGATGPQGPQGETGATGIAGTNGTTWFNGTGAPSSSLGVNNDFYFDAANNDVYNKVSGVWIKKSSIQGATGPTGSAGPTGATGPVGATGPQGPPGATVNSYTNIGYIANLNYAGNNLGGVTITAPANGIVHVTLTGYAQMYNNNTCLIGIGSNIGLTDLDVMDVGVSTAGSTDQQTMYSMTSQAVVPVTAGNTYTFYATAYRWGFDDAAIMSLNSIKMTAEFSEK